MLRMDDAPLELLHLRPSGCVAFFVVVVAAAHVEELACVVQLFLPIAVGALHAHRPTRSGRIPTGTRDLVLVADRLVDAEHARRVLDVIEDGLAVGDGLVAMPRAKAVAKREHVGVRADARVAEQIPRAAHRRAALQDCETGRRTTLAQVVSRAHARQACTDDQHIELRIRCRGTASGRLRGGGPFDRRLHVPSLFLAVRRLGDGLGKPALNVV